MISFLVILIFSFIFLISTQQYYVIAQKDTFFKVDVTFIEGQNRNVSDARVDIQKYPQHGTNPDGNSIDLNDAFYNEKLTIDFNNFP